VIDGEEYKVTPNENNNNDTLHGGPDGWDYVRSALVSVDFNLLTTSQRNFTVVSHTSDSITFSIVDPDGKEGFPGEVISYITYTLTPYTWYFKMVALSTTKKTPIMLSSHVCQFSINL
jgi:aldose 1-epimerase